MILITGGSGFLGRSIINHLDAPVVTLGRNNSDIECDLKSNVPLLNQSFNVVVHAAGKAHIVPKTIAQRQEFYDTNVKGTQNLLLGLEQLPTLPKAFIFISSVAVYGAQSGQLINEEYPLLATDPYGDSKIKAEKLVEAWCAQHNVICTILRLPLLVGTNPPGNLGAMIKGIEKGYYFNIAGGKAKKSMVLVQDVAKIIPIAADIGGVYNLTDGCHPNFFELSQTIAGQLHKSQPVNIPMWLASLLAKAGDLIGSKSPINSIKLKKITSDLTFDDTKARQLLGWKPVHVLNSFLIN